MGANVTGNVFMLIACNRCHRQYDVTGLAVGAKIRCLCEELIEVVRVEPREMEMLRCSSCGGQLTAGAKACGFCGSSASLADRGYGGVCPECFARMPAGASFCCTCGVAIRPTSQLQPLKGKSCPRCEAGTLAIEEFADGAIVECTGCGGVWLDESLFENMTKEREKNAVSKYVQARATAVDPQAATRGYDADVHYLKCPMCAQRMHRKNFANASGVIIDWCRGHGFWFDRNELERIIKFIAEGGLEMARDKEHSRREADLCRERARLEMARSQLRSPSAVTGLGVGRGGGGFWVHGLVETIRLLFSA